GGQQVEDRLRAAGVAPRMAFRSDDNATLQAMVATGIGIALVPRLTVNEADPRIAVIELGSSVPPRLIGLAWHRDRYRSPAALAFVDVARELCSELQETAATGRSRGCAAPPAARVRYAREPAAERAAQRLRLAD